MHPVGNAWGLLMYYLKLNGRAKNNGLTQKVNPNCPAEVTRLVPVAGVEPARYCYHGILSPARLPIPPHRQITKYIISYPQMIVKNFLPYITLTLC